MKAMRICHDRDSETYDIHGLLYEESRPEFIELHP